MSGVLGLFGLTGWWDAREDRTHAHVRILGAHEAGLRRKAEMRAQGEVSVCRCAETDRLTLGRNGSPTSVTNPDVGGLNAIRVGVGPRHTDLTRPFDGRGLTAILGWGSEDQTRVVPRRRRSLSRHIEGARGGRYVIRPPLAPPASLNRPAVRPNNVSSPTS